MGEFFSLQSPYQTEEDYWRIREFLREVSLHNDRHDFSWDVLRWGYWRWHVNENIFQRNGRRKRLMNRINPRLETKRLVLRPMLEEECEESHVFSGAVSVYRFPCYNLRAIIAGVIIELHLSLPSRSLIICIYVLYILSSLIE